MNSIIGIDPGWSGGIAITSSEKNYAKGFTNMTETDIYEEIENVRRYGGKCVAYLEKVHSMPKQGVASSFKFGHNYGFIRGCLTALKIPFYEVSPQKWQSTLGCLSGGDKNVTKSMAQRLYPELKITHATADALLIATYGMRHQVQEFLLT